MKKIIVVACCLLTVLSHAQEPKNLNDFFLYEPTAVGIPDGEKNSMLIGKEGGHIISGDGKIELIFPAGALSSETSISIQPATNTAPDGIGKSYSLEPSGIVFMQPVQLIFHYSDVALDGNSPQLAGIVSQDNKGVWYGLKKIELDTIAKTLKGNISHFSFWSMDWAIHFKPEKTKVKVSKTLKIYTYLTPLPGTVLSERREAVLGVFGEHFENPIIWTVNGVVDGDAANGTIDNIIFPLLDNYVTYKAPDKVPEKNPVEVILEIQNVDLGLENNIPHTVTRKCSIRVYDDVYKVNMITSMKGGSPLAWGGVVTYNDAGSFLVSLDNNKQEIIDIENNLETVTDNCKKIILNPLTCTGMIHITGVKEIKVTPGQPNSVIQIAFIQKRAEFTQIKYTCPPPPGSILGTAKINNLGGLGLLMSIPAQPVYLKFNAKDGEQVLEERGTPGSELYYKIWVKKITE